MSRANPATTHPNAGIASWRFNLKGEVHSYEDAADFLGSVTSRQLGPHMWVQIGESNYLSVRLYNTEIIRYYRDGTFSVDNGGWNTPTTTYRLQAVLPPGWHCWHEHKQITLAHQGRYYRRCTHNLRLEVTQ